MKRLTLVTLGLLVSLSASARTINLQQATELALESDPRIAEKEAFVRQARGLLQEVDGNGGLRYGVDTFLALTTGLDGGFYKDNSNQCNTANQCEPRNDLYDFNDGLSLWAQLQFTIIKPLLTFGRLENYEEAAENNIIIKQQDVLIQREATRENVETAYFGYLTARDSRYLLEDTQKRLQAAADLVQDWLDTGEGDVSLSDKYALDAGLALIKRYLAEAEGLEAIALEGLYVTTGISKDETIELADSRLSPREMPTQDLDELIKLAQDNRPEFKQVEAGLNARRALVEANRADAKPLVYAGLAGSLSRSPERETLDNPFIYDPFNHAALSPLIGLRWEWVSGAQKGKVAQAQAELDALVEKASFARRGIPFQVSEQYHLMKSKYAAAQAMRESAQAARRWMIASYTDFEAGLEKPEKILDAMKTYVLAYAEYLLSVNSYNLHVGKLYTATGVTP